MVRCPKCSKENPEGARFCRSCGGQLSTERGPDAYAPTMLSPEERARRLLEEAFRLSEEGQLQAAIQACQQAVSLNPTSTSAHSLLGTLYERAGDREDAIREYEQVLTLSPGSTVERRRLNELMGVPAAAAPAGVTLRTARLAITAAFGVVGLVLVAAIILTSRQRPEPTKQWLAQRPAGAATMETAEPAVAPGTALPYRLLDLGRPMSPRPFLRQRATELQRTPLRSPAGDVGQWVGPRTFLLPAGGRDRFAGLESGRWQAPSALTAPFLGAVPITTPGPPTVRTPQWRYPSPVTEAGAALSPRVARNYYFQGDYQRAIDAYRGYLNQHPAVGPAPREELAWVYAEAGDYRRASDEYRTALDEYQQDLSRGHNVEAATHGVRTCESAIRALETK